MWIRCEEQPFAAGGVETRTGMHTPRETNLAKEPKQLDDLFHDGLKDIYFAEKKILVALPKMAKAAQTEELSAAFEKHERETEGQVQRLEQVFALIDETPRGKNCPAILGLIEEGKEIIADYKGSPALDAGQLLSLSSTMRFHVTAP